MKKNTKRIIALLLASVMALSFTACNGGGNGGEAGEGTAIKVVTPSHPSAPYQEGWLVWDYIKEAGFNVEVLAIPSADFITKVNLMMTSQDDLPDLIYWDYKNDTNQYALSGALLPFNDYLDDMPNFQKQLDASPVGRDMALAQASAGDGKVYFAPQFCDGILTGSSRSWMYRKDVFDKNNIKAPETLDELIEAARQLKKIYPDSYPFSMRQGLDNIEILGPIWKDYFSRGFYYDYNAEKWSYGALEDTMLDVIKFFHTMLDEDLIIPNFLTITTKAWEELALTDRGFMMPDYSTRMTSFNKPGREIDPEFTFAYLPPIKNESGEGKIANRRSAPCGFTLSNTGDEARIAEAVRYVDWGYGEDGFNLTYWGKEGETYKVQDDEKIHLVDFEKETAGEKWGLGAYGTSLLFPGENVEKRERENEVEVAEFFKVIDEVTLPYTNPVDWLSWNDEEQKVYDEIYTALDTYAQEQLSKFILKQDPLSKWDEFKAELKAIGVDTLLEQYTNAYNRSMGK